jgi:hypothetical protein
MELYNIPQEGLKRKNGCGIFYHTDREVIFTYTACGLEIVRIDAKRADLLAKVGFIYAHGLRGAGQVVVVGPV